MKGDALDLRDRRACFAALEEQTFDLLVIGAGVTGCGVARDAALRGLRTALIDAGDIGCGTSSRSSKLIHGGLRYLLQGDLAVVREAAVERRVLRRIAPHLAMLNPMVIPADSRKLLLQLRMLLWVYERIGQAPFNERHRAWDRRRLARREPLLNTQGLVGAIVYPERITDDLRLTLANARDAARCGARLTTYAAAEEIVMEAGRVVGAVVRGTLPGEDRRARVRASLVVNAAGPWMDAVHRLGDRRAGDRLQLTKGIHLVVERRRLPINNTVVMRAADKRLLFAIPRGRVVYLGATDDFYERPEHWPVIARRDVDYILEATGGVFAGRPLERGDIKAMWAGIRPLLAQPGKKPSEISRRHECILGPKGMLAIVGGKLTSYRSMAQRVVDISQKELGRRVSPCLTAERPLPGGDFGGGPAGLSARLEALGLDARQAERAMRLYGGEALEMFAGGYSLEAEVAQAVLREGALTLEDYWVRRSARARFSPDGGVSALAPAARAMAPLLGWTPEEEARQVATCRALRTKEMAAASGG